MTIPGLFEGEPHFSIGQNGVQKINTRPAPEAVIVIPKWFDLSFVSDHRYIDQHGANTVLPDRSNR
jgi:hypothetical protein